MRRVAWTIRHVRSHVLPEIGPGGMGNRYARGELAYQDKGQEESAEHGEQRTRSMQRRLFATDLLSQAV